MTFRDAGVLLGAGFFLSITSCAHPAPPAPPAPRDPCITLLATNDLHGTLEPRTHGPPGHSVREGGLPLLASYISAARSTAKHPVLLLDAGDMYRGSFASDHFEGRPTIEAMTAMHYDASVLGNHEFDFGGGEGGSSDTLAVVKQRVAEAGFPILAVNVFDHVTGLRIDWPNTKPGMLKRVGDVNVGIIGMSTVSTPTTTFAHNVEALEFRDQAPLVQEEASALRKQGAELIVLLGHVGTECKSIDDPRDSSSCDATSELQQLLAHLPKGTVDVAVAGHTHREVANWIDGVPVIESGSYARRLGRIDLCLAPGGGLDAEHTLIRKPVALCETTWSDGTCGDPPKGDTKTDEADYEGITIYSDPVIEKLLGHYFDTVQTIKAGLVGIRLPAPLRRTATLMPQPPVKVRKRMVQQPPKMESVGDYIARGLAELAGTNLAFVNLGSVRNDLPMGDLTFSAIYDVAPFGNHVAVLRLHKNELQQAMHILARDRREPPITLGFEVRMAGDKVTVTQRGKPLRDGVIYEVATTDFMALGGDGIGPALAKLAPEDRRVLEPVDRDALMKALRARYPAPLPDKVDTSVDTEPTLRAKPGP